MQYIFYPWLFNTVFSFQRTANIFKVLALNILLLIKKIIPYMKLKCAMYFKLFMITSLLNNVNVNEIHC